MSKDPTRESAIRDYLRVLGNPYAKLQIGDDCEDESSEFRPMTDAERAYVRRQENPYAVLSVALKEPVAPQKQAVVRAVKTSDGEMSRSDFERESRRIFVQYSPPMARGRLREPHRAFIERNRTRAPKHRYQLVRELRRYDLSGVAGGPKPLFNRERDELTNAKLKEIERAVFGSDE